MKEQYRYQLYDQVGRIGEPVVAETLTEAVENNWQSDDFAILHCFHGMAVLKSTGTDLVFGCRWEPVKEGQ
jgi:hypothetical protein